MRDPSRRVRVATKTLETPKICSLELVAEDANALPVFSSGAHIDVHLPNYLTRQYSLYNCSSDTHRYAIAVLREENSRGGSIAVHDSIKVGDILQISRPKNHFHLVEDAAHSVLVAGGIGITPLLSMAEWLSRNDRAFELHYCTRSKSATAFLTRIAASSYARCVTFHFDDSPADNKLDMNALLHAPTTDVHLYVCGPMGFMNAVLQCASKKGWDADHIHTEYFSAELVSTEGSGFYVKLVRSQRLLLIPSDKTVVDVLREVGIDIDVSCEQGVCGTCLTRVLEGLPDHRDIYLTPEEHARNDQFTPCCSRAISQTLVLDL
jgi:vanillate O-demethylase ferredoxin subunit